MYKKLIPTLLFIGSSVASFAQVPILTADNCNPILGDENIVINCDTFFVSPMTPGPNQIWDFSSTLEPMSFFPLSTDTGTAIPPYAAATGSSYPSSNVAVVFPSTSGTVFFAATSTALSQYGLYISSTENAKYTDPMDQLHYPCTYPSNFTDTYAGAITFPFLGVPATVSGSVTVTCDGYGTLILPGIPSISYANVLRIHSIQTYTDHANIFGIDTSANFQLETYTWYTPGYHYALLTIATVTGVGNSYFYKTVAYAVRDIPTHEGVPSVNNMDASLKLFPNPAQNELNIDFIVPANEPVRVSLCDVMGREVAVIGDKYSQGAQQISYNTTSLSKGTYLVRLQSGAKTITRKVEIQ